MDTQTPDTIHYYYQYYPPGVTDVLASDASTWIGAVNESTVLKYPFAPDGDTTRLEVERKLLEIIGPHERIIHLKGYTDTGIYLERTKNGNIGDYILEWGLLSIPVKQRLVWCREAAEAVAHIHSRRVLHCDLHPMNLLLDDDLHVKLADFQDKQLSENGEVLLDGGDLEPSRFYCPRNDPFDADIKTGLFALGCVIYFIMLGYAAFPDIVDGEEGWSEMVEGRFESRMWPSEEHLCRDVAVKCWEREYESAGDVVRDIAFIERRVAFDSVGGFRSWVSFALLFPVTVIRRAFGVPVFLLGWFRSVLGLGRHHI